MTPARTETPPLTVIGEIVANVGGDRTRLVDVLVAAQSHFGVLADVTLGEIAAELRIPYVDVVDTASFYAFFARVPHGRCQIHFSKTPISMMKGALEVVRRHDRSPRDT